MKRGIVATVTAAAALVLTMGTTGPAQAAAFIKVNSDNGCAQLRFYTKGEHLYLEDTCRDGRSAVAFIKRTGNTGGGSPHLENRGYGKIGHWNKDWPEGRRVDFMVCTLKGRDFEDAYYCNSRNNVVV
ncbi:hypothetical protein DB35_02815 [Streptomyces abyssalis]|uniref:Spore-associated protein A n=1 Tax=Streptomyces abyssalis TaxID=933944 RepID=A0A1E7JPQ3_9ACTN|nr:hypothetical protein [Streptomyces abyssalis]OEU90236.1 hypothetical protein AN215_11960 [Streptomyces abyssalis]OEU94970.1 hypothetical protein DB35_02815 [Streptomyces abyssalis]